jgi:hypothetical protein
MKEDDLFNMIIFMLSIFFIIHIFQAEQYIPHDDINKKKQNFQKTLDLASIWAYNKNLKFKQFRNKIKNTFSKNKKDIITKNKKDIITKNKKDIITKTKKYNNDKITFSKDILEELLTDIRKIPLMKRRPHVLEIIKKIINLIPHNEKVLVIRELIKLLPPNHKIDLQKSIPIYIQSDNDSVQSDGSKFTVDQELDMTDAGNSKCVDYEDQFLYYDLGYTKPHKSKPKFIIY